tara:strand:+ start:438 stop:722 length:285 start_codon:yes stop_codon:yes gene_type:complete
MRNTKIVILLLLPFGIFANEESASVQHADVQRESAHSQICNAALDSKDAAKAKALSLKVGRRELSHIRCNEMTVMEFAKSHGQYGEEWSIATVQ